MMLPSLKEKQLLQKTAEKAIAEAKWKEMQAKNRRDAETILLQIKLQLSRTT